MNKIHAQKGYSVIEYVVLMTVVLVAFLAFQPYFLRGFQGKLRSSGESFGFGRQYDPHRTMECAYSDYFGAWYDVQCYDSYTYGGAGCPAGDGECVMRGCLLACPISDKVCLSSCFDDPTAMPYNVVGCARNDGKCLGPAIRSCITAACTNF